MSIDRMTLAEKAEYYSKQSFDSIPVIDLADATCSDQSRRKALGLEIQKASLTAGFFYVKNHGVDEALVTAAFKAAQDFFALPNEVKAQIDVSKSDTFKGWTDIKKSKSGEDKAYAGDNLEAFDIGMALEVAQKIPNFPAVPAEIAKLGENLWLDEGSWAQANAFRSTLLDYYIAILSLGRRLLPLFAIALDVEETFFDDKTRTGFANQRMLYYPPLQGKPSDPSQPGIGAHRDYQLFTILLQDHVGGLEVCNLDGQWIDAKPVPGTFVINIGNQLSRWTNYVFKSTMHRVRPPPAFTPRQSSPMFFGADESVLLQPIPTCVAHERPFPDQIVTAGEYINMQLGKVYGKT